MNTFWLKMAALVVVVIGLIILVNVFLYSKAEPKTRPKTFYDAVEQDDKRLRAEPEVKQPPQAGSQRAEIESTKPQFKELSPEDKLQAEKLFEMALAHRKMGRLPGMGYKQMVDYCRQIIDKFPDSSYAFKARRMLGDIPKRYWKQYNITKEEINPPN